MMSNKQFSPFLRLPAYPFRHQPLRSGSHAAIKNCAQPANPLKLRIGAQVQKWHVHSRAARLEKSREFGENQVDEES
jgi:hypothetical protein